MNREELGRLYPVFIHEYDARWPVLFEKEKARLLELLGRDLRIEHMGSTSVTGLAAKPTVDIIVERPHGLSGEEIISIMVRAGYIHMEEQEGHLMFVKGYGPRGLEEESFHIHIAPDAEWFSRHIAFRDLLRADRRLARQYQELKRELSVRFRHDREAYTEAKTAFITGALDRVKREGL